MSQTSSPSLEKKTNCSTLRWSQAHFFVLGGGATGKSVIDFLLSQDAHVYFFDDKAETRLQMHAMLQDHSHFHLIDSIDEIYRIFKLETFTALILSPGIALSYPQQHLAVTESLRSSVPVWSDIELFFKSFPNYRALAAITGTNGKSSLTSMIAESLKKLGFHTEVCGNIGTPILEFAPQIQDGKKSLQLVIELSSFQLETTPSVRARFVVLTNITPDHEDRYPFMRDYAQTKAHIFDNLAANDIGFLRLGDPWSLKVLSEHPKRQRFFPINTDQELDAFFKEELLSFPKEEQTRLGHLNTIYTEFKQEAETALSQFTALTAYTGLIGLALGCKAHDLVTAISSFKGLVHRQEIFLESCGVSYINDSKATNVAAVKEALRRHPKSIWFVGGQLKGNDSLKDLIPFTKELSEIIFFGQDAEKISNALSSPIIPFRVFGSLKEALGSLDLRASSLKSRGIDSVLFSPIGTSLDEFSSFSDRGDYFKATLLTQMLEKSE